MGDRVSNPVLSTDASCLPTGTQPAVIQVELLSDTRRRHPVWNRLLPDRSVGGDGQGPDGRG